MSATSSAPATVTGSAATAITSPGMDMLRLAADAPVGVDFEARFSAEGRVTACVTKCKGTKPASFDHQQFKQAMSSAADAVAPTLPSAFGPLTFKHGIIAFRSDNDHVLHADAAPAPAPDASRFAEDIQTLVHAHWPDGHTEPLVIVQDYKVTQLCVWLFPHEHDAPLFTFLAGHDCRVISGNKRVPAFDPDASVRSLIHASAHRWFAKSPRWFLGFVKFGFATEIAPPSAHERSRALTRVDALR